MLAPTDPPKEGQVRLMERLYTLRSVIVRYCGDFTLYKQCHSRVLTP